MMNNRKFLLTGLLGFVALSASALSAAPATTTPSLGTAANFAILGGPAVTCTDSSIKGDVGTGFPGAPIVQTNCPVVGNLHAGDSVAQQAYNDFRLAYLATAQVACPTDPAHVGQCEDDRRQHQPGKHEDELEADAARMAAGFTRPALS